MKVITGECLGGGRRRKSFPSHLLHPRMLRKRKAAATAASEDTARPLAVKPRTEEGRTSSTASQNHPHPRCPHRAVAGFAAVVEHHPCGLTTWGRRRERKEKISRVEWAPVASVAPCHACMTRVQAPRGRLTATGGGFGTNPAGGGAARGGWRGASCAVGRSRRASTDERARLVGTTRHRATMEAAGRLTLGTSSMVAGMLSSTSGGRGGGSCTRGWNRETSGLLFID